MFSSTVNPDEESEVTLKVSVAAAPFVACHFPYRISEHEYDAAALPPFLNCIFVTLLCMYRVLDASESNVFVEVDHGQDASLYTSGHYSALHLLPTSPRQPTSIKHAHVASHHPSLSHHSRTPTPTPTQAPTAPTSLSPSSASVARPKARAT